MSGVRSFTRGATPKGASTKHSAPIYVDSDDNRVKVIPAGTGTAETILQEAGGASVAEVLTAAKTLTAADSGKTFFLNLAAGFAVTLPSPAAGLNFRFFIQTAPVTTSYTIVGTPMSAIVRSSVGGNADSIVDDTAVNIEFDGDAAVIGDSAEVWSNGTGWFGLGLCNADAGILIN